MPTPQEHSIFCSDTSPPPSSFSAPTAADSNPSTRVFPLPVGGQRGLLLEPPPLDGICRTLPSETRAVGTEWCVLRTRFLPTGLVSPVARATLGKGQNLCPRELEGGRAAGRAGNLVYPSFVR